MKAIVPSSVPQLLSSQLFYKLYVGGGIEEEIILRGNDLKNFSKNFFLWQLEYIRFCFLFFCFFQRAQIFFSPFSLCQSQSRVYREASGKKKFENTNRIGKKENIFRERKKRVS